MEMEEMKQYSQAAREKIQALISSTSLPRACKAM